MPERQAKTVFVRLSRRRRKDRDQIVVAVRQPVGTPALEIPGDDQGTKTRNADYYVCFGRNDSENPRNYTLFCFPVEFLRGGNVNVSLDARNEWAKFRIEPHDLSGFFDAAQEKEITDAGKVGYSVERAVRL